MTDLLSTVLLLMNKKQSMGKEKRIGTTLIIGNGFDLSLGMNTSYKAFFQKMEAEHFFEKNDKNHILAYIHQKGVQECWYSFEDIIREYALFGEEAQWIKFCHKMLDTIYDLLNFKDDALKKIQNFDDLIIIVPTIEKLAAICKQFSNVNMDLQKKIRPLCTEIRKEVELYYSSIRKECVHAISLLTDELNLFIKAARPKYEYAPAIKLLCALIGCDDKGFNGWSEKIYNNYNSSQGRYYFPKFGFISFNYTDPFYHISHVIERRSNRNLCTNTTTIKNRVYNIHGTLDKNIAFGVDEDDSIPKELWSLRKCNSLEENAKKKFYDLLCKSNRIVIFGHSLHGIDFEYYEDFFRKKNEDCNIFIIGHKKESLDQIKSSLESKGVSLRAKYIVVNDECSDDFDNLCQVIQQEQHHVLR